MRKELIYVHAKRRYEDFPLNITDATFVSSAQHCVQHYYVKLAMQPVCNQGFIKVSFYSFMNLLLHYINKFRNSILGT